MYAKERSLAAMDRPVAFRLFIEELDHLFQFAGAIFCKTVGRLYVAEAIEKFTAAACLVIKAFP
jgi:hypothetical protein